MFKKKDFKKIIGRLKKTPYFLVENDFWSVLFLIFIALFIGFFLFYKYVVLLPKETMPKKEKNLFLDEKKFQEVLKIMKERERNFDQASLKDYPNPFQKK